MPRDSMLPRERTAAEDGIFGTNRRRVHFKVNHVSRSPALLDRPGTLIDYRPEMLVGYIPSIVPVRVLDLELEDLRIGQIARQVQGHIQQTGRPRGSADSRHSNECERLVIDNALGSGHTDQCNIHRHTTLFRSQ